MLNIQNHEYEKKFRFDDKYKVCFNIVLINHSKSLQGHSFGPNSIGLLITNLSFASPSNILHELF